MVDFNTETDGEPRGSGGTSIATLQEFTRGDLVLIRSLATQGVIPADRMAGMTNQIAGIVESEETSSRLKVAAYKALAALQLGMMKILAELHRQQAPAGPMGGVTNQQINIYLPSNERETKAAINGHHANGSY